MWNNKTPVKLQLWRDYCSSTAKTQTVSPGMICNTIWGVAHLPFEQQQHRVSSAGVQPCGRFIQEENWGIDNQLHADVSPLPLPSGDSSGHLRAHLRKDIHTINPVVTLACSSHMYLGRVCISTLQSATLLRPSSWMRWLTRASFSLWGTELGSRSAAENRRFSLTVKVPMTTSSWRPDNSFRTKSLHFHRLVNHDRYSCTFINEQSLHLQLQESIIYVSTGSTV